jgi:type VI secretion system secreted protein VgrG
MANKFSQANRPLAVVTPLGEDKLLLEAFQATERLCVPYRFELVMLAQPEYEVPFDKLLGQSVSVRLDTHDKKERWFNGIVRQVSEGSEVAAPDTGEVFLRYFAEVVPKLYLLTQRVGSRIFQQKSVVDILMDVFRGLDVSYKLQGDYEPRDYCVQYRESDFQFASRLMEDEGMYYYFTHEEKKHTLVVADSPQGHPDIPGEKKVVFSDFLGLRDRRLHEDRIVRWQKTQELRPGSYRVWDYSFEVPDKNLEAAQAVADSVAVGKVTHKLKVGGNDKLEVYDYPGGYAKRFDGVAPGGGDRAADVAKIEQDNARTVKIRMAQETASALVIAGEGNVRRFEVGHKFTLAEHNNAEGGYVIVGLDHSATMHGAFTTNEAVSVKYKNSFQCIPEKLPFRPGRTCPKPVIHGTQTAVVVGDGKSEIVTDKYGRVKVQFRWDRQGKKDLDSSCWVRVAQPLAGKQWGAFFLPRVGQEVLVAFEDGDPDQPIVVGSVYNADQMPPYALPDNKTRTLLKTRSTEKGTAENFNELRFEDKKDQEEVYFHAEKDFNRVVENNDTLKVGFEKKDPGDQTIEVHHDRSITVKTGNETILIEKGSGSTEAKLFIELKVGESSIKIEPTSITLKAATITLQGEGKVDVSAKMTQVAGDTSLILQGGTVKIN